MADIKFTNFAYSQLAVGITAGDVVIVVTTGTGSRFPSLGAGEYFYATLEDALLNREIVRVHTRVGDTFTVDRAQDNTSALAWVAGDSIALRLNAAAIDEVFDAVANTVRRSTATGSAILPGGTTAQRDGTPAAGYFRHNSTLSAFEGYSGAAWTQMLDTQTDQTFSGAKRAAITVDNDLSLDLTVGNNFSCTPTGNGTLTFTNISDATGQSGYIKLVNEANYTISAAATTKIAAAALTTLSATGTYILTYFCDGTNVFVSASGSLA